MFKGYTVESMEEGGIWKEQNALYLMNKATIFLTKNNQIQTFRVRASNEHGISDPSNIVVVNGQYCHSKHNIL